MKISTRKKSINNVETIINNFCCYYVGPKLLGHYGRLDDVNYKEAKYLSGHTKRLFSDYKIVVLDKKARVIAENVYENGKGNIFFCNVSDEYSWTRYFNKEDSKIIKNYYKRAGKKPYMDIHEDLQNIVGEQKIKMFYDKNVHNKEVLIDNKKHVFNRYKDFRKVFNIVPGFGRSWTIKAGYQEAIISIHTITYYQWIEIIY